MSTVTGKRRDQLEKELKEASEEANWKSFLAGLNPEDAENEKEKEEVEA